MERKTAMKPKIRITFNAPLVLSFALACTAATVIRLIAGETADRVFATYRSSWADPMTYIRLFTHVLGHTGFGHLLGNMAYILLLGPMLEEKYGWKNLLAVILVTAVVTGLVHNLLFPQAYLLGASGVVFAFILLTAFAEVKEGEIPLTFILVAAIYLGQQIWDGITVKDNVSNLTHIIGGLVGGGAGYVLNIRRKK
jgi:GlpG protein